MEPRQKWLALIVLCAAVLMQVLDTTIVNVALPAIKASLGFSTTDLAWIINAYTLSFGGLLMLGGRLGDLYGPRKLFIVGISLFTLASLACGLSFSQSFLIFARGAQGIGGAITSAVSLAILMNLFREPAERATAMGYFGFVAAGGGSVGVLLGGFLTAALNWHWIFLVNVPVGIVVVMASLRLLPKDGAKSASGKLDAGGAALITLSLVLATFGIVGGNDAGWHSARTLSTLGAAIVLLAAFIFLEARVSSPLIPLDLFKKRNLAVASVVGVLWSAAMFSWFFISALYLQLVLGYSALQVGLAFLPANLIMAAFSFSLSARLVNRFGFRAPLSAGLALAAAGLALLSRAPSDASFWIDLLPSMILLGIGAGVAFNPMLLAAMNDAPESEAGIASGIVNTAFMMGGALGLAILASAAASQTARLANLGASSMSSLAGGYHAAFLLGAAAAAIGAALSAGLLKGSAVRNATAIAR